MTTLSERAIQLIPKARIVSFETWKKSQPQQLIDIFQEADDEGRYLTENDLQAIQKLSPDSADSIDIVKFLRENAADIIAEARKEVLAKFPDITAPGGDLYPQERAKACWRDFWHFLRSITYGIAGQNTQFTSEEGLENMRLLYEELRVPIEAMIVGLQSIKSESLGRLDAKNLDIEPYFDHLITNLKSFKSDQ